MDLLDIKEGLADGTLTHRQAADALDTVNFVDEILNTVDSYAWFNTAASREAGVGYGLQADAVLRYLRSLLEDVCAELDEEAVERLRWKLLRRPYL